MRARAHACVCSGGTWLVWKTLFIIGRSGCTLRWVWPPASEWMLREFVNFCAAGWILLWVCFGWTCNLIHTWHYEKRPDILTTKTLHFRKQKTGRNFPATHTSTVKLQLYRRCPRLVTLNITFLHQKSFRHSHKVTTRNCIRNPINRAAHLFLLKPGITIAHALASSLNDHYGALRER